MLFLVGSILAECAFVRLRAGGYKDHVGPLLFSLYKCTELQASLHSGEQAKLQISIIGQQKTIEAHFSARQQQQVGIMSNHVPFWGCHRCRHVNDDRRIEHRQPWPEGRYCRSPQCSSNRREATTEDKQVYDSSSRRSQYSWWL